MMNKGNKNEDLGKGGGKGKRRKRNDKVHEFSTSSLLREEEEERRFANFNDGSPRWIISIGIVTGVETPLQTRNSAVVHFTTSQTRSQTMPALFIAAWFSRSCSSRFLPEEVAARIKADSPTSNGIFHISDNSDTCKTALFFKQLSVKLSVRFIARSCQSNWQNFTDRGLDWKFRGSKLPLLPNTWYFF